MYVKSEGILSFDPNKHGYYDVLKEIEKHRQGINNLMCELSRMDLIIETSIKDSSEPEKSGPLSITIKNEPAYEILKQVDDHRKSICDLLIELKMLTEAVERNINQSLTAAM